VSRHLAVLRDAGLMYPRTFATAPDGRAGRWLRKPKRSLDGRAPLEQLATEAGARLVEEALFRIDHGLAA
jgi:uncharacterized protein (DUF2384 family)